MTQPRTRSMLRVGVAVVLWCLSGHSLVTAQQPSAPGGTASQAADPNASTLPQRQSGVAQRYGKLEELLLRLADVEADENPERAALLRRAARQSREKFTLDRLQGATEALQSEQYQNAVQRQTEAAEGIEALLTLLLSEDRSKRIRDEKQRIGEMIKDLKRIERAQRSARARTENDAELSEVEKEQQSITERADELNKDLKGEESEEASKENGNEEISKEENKDAQKKGESGKTDKKGEPKKGEPKKGEPKDGEPKDGEPKDGEPKDGEPKDGEPQDGEPKDGEPKDGEPKDGKPQSGEPKESEPSDSQPQDGQPKDSKPQEGQPPSGDQKPQPGQEGQSSETQPSPPQQPQSPQQQAEEQLQDAIKKMQEAEKKLAEAKRDEATEAQRAAEENLRAAIDRLERILRQLREEEMQRELAKLEARLRKMAAMQSKVLDDTVTLAATPESQRNRQTDLKAGDLAFEEKKITLEADRAMLLLREEGSSVAFPEVVDAIRSDTVKVADRLAETKIDEVTQGIQKDILANLEEMIGALQKAQRDLEQKKQQEQQGQPQQQGQGEEPLVEALAELKLIRTMETRIKGTTERYAELLEAGETTGDDVLPLLQGLAERQNRLYRITRDLVQKRNQ